MRHERHEENPFPRSSLPLSKEQTRSPVHAPAARDDDLNVAVGHTDTKDGAWRCTVGSIMVS